MAAVNYSFPIEQGSDFEISFQYKDEAGNNIDLRGWCVLLQLQTNIESDPIKVFSNKITSSDYSLTADGSGRITFKIPSKTTNSYLFDSAVYDLDIQEPSEQFNNSGLKTYRLATGTISIIKRNIPTVLTDCATLFVDQSDNEEENNLDNTNINNSLGFINSSDLCLSQCTNLDIFAKVYSGSGINILDNSISSGTITINDSRKIENIDLVIEGLTHSSVQDLSLLLAAPSGNKVLLSANDKILNYTNNFSFAFSNKALGSNVFLNNVTNGGLCQIRDKTSDFNYSNETLVSSFDHLIGHSIPGDWTLLVRDSDVGASGSISGWKLIVTYQEENI